MFDPLRLYGPGTPFSNVWIAANHPNKLKRHDYNSMDLLSTVQNILQLLREKEENIMQPGGRALALLVLGVARIFSKKVDDLLQDYRTLSDSMEKLSVWEDTTQGKMQAFFITRPETFNLDKLNLGEIDKWIDKFKAGIDNDFHQSTKDEITLPSSFIDSLQSSLRDSPQSSPEDAQPPSPGDSPPSSPLELDFLLSENTPASSQGGTSGTLSERTRNAALYLRRILSDAPSQNMSLKSILRGRSSEICTRMFFEVMVLKSLGYIEVTQGVDCDVVLMCESPIFDL